jgi:hypothetical protein
LFASVEDADGEAETLNNLGDLALDHAETGDPYTYFGRTDDRAADRQHQTRGTHPGRAGPMPAAHRSDQAIALLRQAHELYHTLGAPEAAEIEAMLSTLDPPGGT